MDAWDCKYVLNVWKWMYLIEALYVCTLKFDCEWGNGMGPQGLGMVPWESPSGLLSPSLPWVQWYWHSWVYGELNLNYIGLKPLKLGNFKFNCLIEGK